MSDAPKLKSFVTVLAFAVPGPIVVETWLAPDAASAAALAGVRTARSIPGEWPLASCVTLELSAEMLRHHLRAVEGERTGDVLSLVSSIAGLRDGMTISNSGGPLDGHVVRMPECPDSEPAA